MKRVLQSYHHIIFAYCALQVNVQCVLHTLINTIAPLDILQNRLAVAFIPTFCAESDPWNG